MGWLLSFRSLTFFIRRDALLVGRDSRSMMGGEFVRLALRESSGCRIRDA